MLANEAIELADGLEIPCYLHATVDEAKWLEKLDFSSVPDWKSEGEHPVMPMRREPHEPKHRSMTEDQYEQSGGRVTNWKQLPPDPVVSVQEVSGEDI